jgi:hypothetical protein
MNANIVAFPIKQKRRKEISDKLRNLRNKVESFDEYAQLALKYWNEDFVPNAKTVFGVSKTDRIFKLLSFTIEITRVEIKTIDPRCYNKSPTVRSKANEQDTVHSLVGSVRFVYENAPDTFDLDFREFIEGIYTRDGISVRSTSGYALEFVLMIILEDFEKIFAKYKRRSNLNELHDHWVSNAHAKCEKKKTVFLPYTSLAEEEKQIEEKLKQMQIAILKAEAMLRSCKLSMKRVEAELLIETLETTSEEFPNELITELETLIKEIPF